MMKRKWYFLVFVLAVVFVFTGMAVSAPKRPTTVTELALYNGADRQQILEEGARKEGKLTFYTNHTQISPIVAAFQKKYTYIKVETWSARMFEAIPRTLQEYDAGRHVVDVMAFNKAEEIVFEEKKILHPFYSPNLVHIEEATIKRTSSGGAMAAGHYRSAIGLGYNTNLITMGELPKSYQDLLVPKWKGEMPIVGSGTGVYLVGGLLVNFGEDFVNQLAQQKFVVHMVSANALLDMIINGEYKFSPTIMNSHVNNSKKKGAPVGWIPLEPVPCYIGLIMLPKHPPHPHAALLFIDFDLSEETGELYIANGYDSPRKDILSQKSQRVYQKYYGPESTQQLTKWTKLFESLFLKKE